MNRLQSDSSAKAPVVRHRKPSVAIACVLVVVDVKVAGGVVLEVVEVSSAALVLWHPGTIESGRQNFLSGSNAKFSGQDFLAAVSAEHSM
jgi:hypothetical protein